METLIGYFALAAAFCVCWVVVAAEIEKPSNTPEDEVAGYYDEI